VHQKIEAGATGIITQPFLTASAMDTFEQYPMKGKITYVAGMALPKTVKSIQFWKQLLSPQVDVEDDPLFQDHVRYFASGNDPDQWAQDQKKMLQTIPGLKGFHYMPMKNVDGLLKIVDKD
jgi:5,10-methylenetetrahydrofolate reductase